MVWTAGVRPASRSSPELGLPLDQGAHQGRLVPAGRGRARRLGGRRRRPPGARRRPRATSSAVAADRAQHADPPGRSPRNIAARSGRRKKFTLQAKGVVVDLGRRKAVADTMCIKWSGHARVADRPLTYHLAMMPGGNGPAARCSPTGTSAAVRARLLRARAVGGSTRSATPHEVAGARRHRRRGRTGRPAGPYTEAVDLADR
jgi:hypothetical protein